MAEDRLGDHKNSGVVRRGGILSNCLACAIMTKPAVPPAVAIKYQYALGVAGSLCCFFLRQIGYSYRDP